MNAARPNDFLFYEIGEINMTVRLYPTAIREDMGNGLYRNVQAIAHAAAIIAFCTKDIDGEDADGSGTGILACTIETTGLNVGSAVLVRDGKEIASLKIEKSDDSRRFLRARCSPTVKAQVGDEITQYTATP